MFLQRRGIIFADGEKHEEARTVASRFFSKHGLKSLTKSANGGAASSSSSVAAMKEKLSRKLKQNVVSNYSDVRCVKLRGSLISLRCIAWL